MGKGLAAPLWALLASPLTRNRRLGRSPLMTDSRILVRPILPLQCASAVGYIAILHTGICLQFINN